MNYIEQANYILKNTNNGALLEAHDLHLVKSFTNVNSYEVSEAQEAALDDILERVGHLKPWLHGIENLTKDYEGYVYWRNRKIEHFSYNENEVGEQLAAQKLASRCRELEKQKLPINHQNLSALARKEAMI